MIDSFSLDVIVRAVTILQGAGLAPVALCLPDEVVQYLDQAVDRIHRETQEVRMIPIDPSTNRPGMQIRGVWIRPE